jgi:hypothetical protein
MTHPVTHDALVPPRGVCDSLGSKVRKQEYASLLCAHAACEVDDCCDDRASCFSEGSSQTPDYKFHCAAPLANTGAYCAGADTASCDAATCW